MGDGGREDGKMIVKGIKRMNREKKVKKEDRKGKKGTVLKGRMQKGRRGRKRIRFR